MKNLIKIIVIITAMLLICSCATERGIHGWDAYKYEQKGPGCHHK